MNERYKVRARKSPWIETSQVLAIRQKKASGLVRARGLKPSAAPGIRYGGVRARKSPWIETILAF